MSRVLIIGAGGVGNVVAKKCAQHPDVFQDIVLASRTRSKCDAIAAEIMKLYNVEVRTAQVDADSVPELVALLNDIKPQLVINVALPYQDLTIMDACLECGVNYLDTANYEPHRYRPFRVQLAVGLSGQVPGKGPDGGAGLRFRSRRHQYLLRLRPETPLRQHREHRHPRLQRRRTRPSLRHQLQSGDQYPRGDPDRAPLAGRQVDRDPGHPRRRLCPFQFRLSRGRSARELPPLPRGDGIAGQTYQGPQENPFLDDLSARPT